MSQQWKNKEKAVKYKALPHSPTTECLLVMLTNARLAVNIYGSHAFIDIPLLIIRFDVKS